MAPTRTAKQQPTRKSDRLETAAAIKESLKPSAAVTKKKRFRRPQQRKGCRLLHLPGELRNAIYEYALVVPKTITLQPTGPGEPGLLRTCKAIRNEARRFYYLHNKFRLEVTDYNGAAFASFSAAYVHSDMPRVLAGRKDPGLVTFHLGGDANWDNLIAWLKEARYRHALLPDLDDPVDGSDYVMGGAIRLADAMPWWPWDKTQKALEAYRHGLTGTCSSWGDRPYRH